MIARRSFFAALFAPLVSRLIPRSALPDVPLPSLLDVTYDGGEFIRETIYSDGALDVINAITLRELNSSALRDNIFKQSPLYDLLFKKERILDAGGSVIGQFGRMPGEPWSRLSGGLRQPVTAPRLPA